MSALDLDAIEARAEAATGGEWMYEPDDTDPQDPASMVVLRASPGICVAPFLTLRDALFIAAARSDVPALVALARTQAAEIATLRAFLPAVAVVVCPACGVDITADLDDDGAYVLRPHSRRETARVGLGGIVWCDGGTVRAR